MLVYNGPAQHAEQTLGLLGSELEEPEGSIESSQKGRVLISHPFSASAGSIEGDRYIGTGHS